MSARNRSHIITHLLRERTVARFVVAPNGYGKTSVAAEYAETVFSWERTLWINCQSPCFLRDLDTAKLARMCLDADDGVALVVFDDLPALGHERSEQLSRDIDALLEAPCEVVVTCKPTSDAFASSQRDRLLVDAKGLLLSDAEIDELRPADERALVPAADVPPSQRVPALAWSEGPETAAAFLQDAFEPAVPADHVLGHASMLLAQHGTLTELENLGLLGNACAEDLMRSNPHLCADPDSDRFDAPLFEVRDIAAALKRRFDEIAAASPFGDKNGLAFAWADALLAPNRNAGRACAIVREVCAGRERIAWLEDQAFRLARLGCFYETLLLLTSARTALAKLHQPTRMRIEAVRSVCLHMLGDTAGAIANAKRYAFVDTPARDARICCLLMIVRHGSDPVRENAANALRAMLGQADRELASCSFFEQAALAECVFLDGLHSLGSHWHRMRDSSADRDVLCLAASWIFDEVCDQPVQEGVPVSSQVGFDLDAIGQFVADELEHPGEQGPSLFAALAGLALERARNCNEEYAGPLPTPIVLDLRQADVALVSQQRAYERRERSRRLRRDNWEDTHPDSLGLSGSYPSPGVTPRSVPVLTVKLFGRFEASLGDEVINPALFKRQHVATLLALLTVNRDREMMRDTLARSLWPQSTDELAAKNFYTVWSQLRKALTLPDGTCPYLIRHQYGCSLNSRFLHTDVERFDEICQEMLFGSPDLDRLAALYGEVQRDFAGDLVPGDQANDLLATARADCLLRLIDALVAAARTATDAGNPLWGIWFARAALSRDRTREDAYVALMLAQIAADQRTAAMMTFLKCQRVLVDELGIDPSPATTAIYRSLLDSL